MENGFINFDNDSNLQICVPILGWDKVHEHTYDYIIDIKHRNEANDALRISLREGLNYLEHLAIDQKDFEAAKSYRDAIILHDRIRQLVEKEEEQIDNPEEDKFKDLSMGDLEGILYTLDKEQMEKQMPLNYNKARKNIISQILLLQAEKENKEQQLQAEQASKGSNASNPGKKKKRKKGEEIEL